MQAAEKYRICVEALKRFVEDAGFEEVVLGLSGGIDSSLTAVMCADAFGADKVHGVLMPGPYSSAHSVEDAQELATALGIASLTIPIVEPYEAFERVVSKAQGSPLEGPAAENTQARCRTVCLMAVSNTWGWLMINTGNKSEAMMGYSTLYGDTAGAYAPLGGLYKTDVYALARWRNDAAEKAGTPPPIPAGTLTKAPSAELSPGQKDESALGIRYADLDRILIALVEEAKLPAEVTEAQGIPLAEVERIQACIQASAFKRALEPPFPEAPFYG